MFVMQRFFMIAVKLRHILPEMQFAGSLKFVRYGQKSQKPEGKQHFLSGLLVGFFSIECSVAIRL